MTAVFMADVCPFCTARLIDGDHDEPECPTWSALDDAVRENVCQRRDALVRLMACAKTDGQRRVAQAHIDEAVRQWRIIGEHVAAGGAVGLGVWSDAFH